MDPVKAIALILIAAFLIDRITTGLFFLLSFSSRWRKAMPDPASVPDPEARERAARKQKLVYAIVAAILGTVVIAGYLEIRLLALMGLVRIDPTTKNPEHAFLDTLLTGLILMAGADRIADALKMMAGGTAERPASKPIEVTGRLVLEESSAKALSGSQSKE